MGSVRFWGALLTLCFLGCQGEERAELPQVELGERLPGGETTNTRLLGANAFLMPAANLNIEDEIAFYGGNGFFNQGWVEAPASTNARDGLGPLFNARSCSGCHFKDGKGEPPEEGDEFFVGLLLRLKQWTGETLVDDPVYGGQLQDQSISSVPREARAHVMWSRVSGMYGDGSEYELRRPTFTLNDFNYGEPEGHLVLSPRIAPHMIGLGLLEAIPESDLVSLSDPADEDGDGISGRISWVATPQGDRVGRFGWRAEVPTVRDQVAEAFAGDMGLTSSLITQDTCTDPQTECLESTSGGEPEVSDHIFGRVVIYSKTIAVPVRRTPDDPKVLKGKQLFNRAQCSRCHTPSYVTGASDIEALSGQLIWPYTDLLLHDMGPDLADENAGPDEIHQEWRTAPLWGVGLTEAVSGFAGFLHDGRARTLEEAILWHGGEAEMARDTFKAFSRAEREALIAFIADL